MVPTLRCHNQCDTFISLAHLPNVVAVPLLAQLHRLGLTLSAVRQAFFDSLDWQVSTSKPSFADVILLFLSLSYSRRVSEPWTCLQGDKRTHACRAKSGRKRGFNKCHDGKLLFQMAWHTHESSTWKRHGVIVLICFQRPVSFSKGRSTKQVFLSNM